MHTRLSTGSCVPTAFTAGSTCAAYRCETALSSSSAALPSLEAFAEHGHILFGTDFPFAPTDVVAAFTRKLDAYEMAPEEKTAIDHSNALALFERLRRMPD
jgi:predicted TIM-barrel fold metal-dependent hydrolase